MFFFKGLLVGSHRGELPNSVGDFLAASSPAAKRWFGPTRGCPQSDHMHVVRFADASKTGCIPVSAEPRTQQSEVSGEHRLAGFPLTPLRCVRGSATAARRNGNASSKT